MPFPSLTRSVLGLAAVVLAAGFCVRSAQAGAIISRPLYLGLDQELVGYWSFEGKTVAGTRVHDASGNGNHGTMTNGPRLAMGKIGQGMAFSGVNDYVNLGSNLGILQNVAAATVSGWAKVDRLALGNIVFVTKNGASGEGRAFLHIESTGKVTVSGRSADTDSLQSVTTIGTISIGRWYHVVGVIDYENDKISIYVDGMQQSTTGTPSFSTATTANTTSDGATIGSNPSPANFFPGLIDDVRIYNRALSADEIKRLYKIGATAKVGTTISNDSLQKGLVGHWTFDGKTIAGTRAHDTSGQGNHGTMTNGPQTAFGKIGQGMEFDGNDDYVDLGNVSALNFTSSFSLSVWMYANQVGGAENSTFHPI